MLDIYPYLIFFSTYHLLCLCAFLFLVSLSFISLSIYLNKIISFPFSVSLLSNLKTLTLSLAFSVSVGVCFSLLCFFSYILLISLLSTVTSFYNHLCLHPLFSLLYFYKFAFAYFY